MNCPNCGSLSLFYGDGDENPLLYCGGCGMGWVGAIPTIAEIEGALRVRDELVAQGYCIINDTLVGRAS